MKHMLVGCALMLSALCGAPASAQDNSLPSQPHLLVKGEASRVVQPDRFAINIALSVVDAEPEHARQVVESEASKVLTAMRKGGASKDSIDASTLSMSPEQRYEEGRQVFKGTRVGRSLRAEFDSPVKLQAFLSTLTTSDRLQINQLQALYSEEAAVRAELKREAAEQSRASAQGLARAYGAKISGLYTISDVAPSFAYGVRAGSWPASSRGTFASPPPPAPTPDVSAFVSEPTFSAGTITLTENVYAIFLIAQ